MLGGRLLTLRSNASITVSAVSNMYLVCLLTVNIKLELLRGAV